VNLGLWSAKGQRTRTLQLQVDPSSPSLGLTLQWTSLSVASNIWHILDVPPNSPADNAGLLPYSDYILGTPEGILHGEAGLGELVEDHIGRPLRLYVYNNEYNVTRELTIHPSRDWGGEGALGCVLGYGALHHLPAPLSEPVAGPGETLFETETARFSNEEPRPSSSPQTFTLADATIPPTGGDFLIPAQLSTPPPPPQGAAAPRKKNRHAHGASPSKAMDEYFMEGEKKSRELDYAPTSKGSGVPPPPKADGPPKAGGPPKADEPKEDTSEQAVSAE
jgi:hypothetical protein